MADLHDCRDKYKKVVKKITFLKSLVKKGKRAIDEYEENLDEKFKELLKLEKEVNIQKRELKDARDHTGNVLSLKGGKEIQESILYFKNYAKVSECSKENGGKDKELMNSIGD